MNIGTTAAFAVITLGLAGCMATTTMNAAQPDTQLRLKSSSATSVPRTEKLTTTSFGNYEFYATSPGLEPFSGILPLKFNGGYLALDILFFAPAMFFNLREPYALYEVDVAQRVVRYKKKAGDPWHDYLPSSAEAARGAKHFHE